jgi:hypothetical protein
VWGCCCPVQANRENSEQEKSYRPIISLLTEQSTNSLHSLLRLLDQIQHTHEWVFTRPTNSHPKGEDLFHRNVGISPSYMELQPRGQYYSVIAMRSSNSFRRLSPRKDISYIKLLWSLWLTNYDFKTSSDRVKVKGKLSL